MSSAPATALYNPVHDPIFSVLSKQVAIDADTHKKATRKIPATAGGYGSAGSASRLNGKRTEFNWSNGTNFKLRWDTTRLNVGVKFIEADATVATAVDVAPSWNLLGKLIKEITLNFDGHGTAIYTKSNGQFKACFTARLLRHYTIDELNKMSSFLFTPVTGDQVYLRQEADSAKYANGGDVLKSTSADYVQIGVSGTACTPAVATGANAFFDAKFGYGGAEERARRYIGSNSHLRTHVLSVPFADLFPRFQGVPKNLRSVQMSIEWNDDTDILEMARADATGVVHIVSCDVTTDDYIQSTGQTIEAMKEKKEEATPDNISFIDTDIMRYQWQASDIIKPSVRNLQDVMIMQFADEVKNVDGTAGSTYQSCGQFLLCNGQGLSASYARASTDEVNTNVADCPSSIQIEYGDVQYPSSPLNMLNGHHFDASGVYYEYLKALGKVADRLNGSPLSRDVFASTMPFIWLRPFANDAVKLSDAKDLIIKMSGSSSNVNTTLKTGDIDVIVFQLKSFRIDVDGTISSPVA